MKRLFGTWVLENPSLENSKAETGELIIEGNDIEFYRQGGSEVFQSAFTCDGGDLHRYKVIAQACRESGTRKTLDHASNYRVAYVLQQNFAFPPGIIAGNFTNCSFAIPELIDWLGVKFTEFDFSNSGWSSVKEKIYKPIRLKDGEPYIEVVFESNTFNKSLKVDNRTSAIVSVQPRIQIKYNDPVTIEEVNRDIEFTMQFWGLMIGKVSVVEDIRLTVEGQNCQLYLNRDYSYNLRSASFEECPRTNLKRIGRDIQCYFSTWYSFCSDKKYDFIRRMYFFVNDRSPKFIEDIFLQYVKILEGFSLRETNDKATSERLEAAIKKCKKEIKGLIFTDAGKPLFAAALQDALPEWKFTSSHADQIAQWIAAGYIGKKGLAERLHELDSTHMNLLTANAATIMKKLNVEHHAVELDDKKVAPEFLKRIVSTRNYFSHYKAEPDGILDARQMGITVNSLKALVVSILYSKMGMSDDVVRKILMWDSELSFQTMFLRKAGEGIDDCLSEEEGKLQEYESLT